VTPEVRWIEVHKRRARYTIGGCMAELSEIAADGHPTRTIAIELEDPGLVIAAVRDLGLGDRTNTCMAKGLKALVGF
jgi:exopolyphosphatase/guanosine-5'-triphosphate,3'-diphosphate pyrophosphatase